MSGEIKESRSARFDEIGSKQLTELLNRYHSSNLWAALDFYFGGKSLCRRRCGGNLYYNTQSVTTAAMDGGLMDVTNTSKLVQ